MVALVLLMHGAAVRFWNYAFYTGAIAAGVLILMDLPQPSSYSAEGYRVLWTLCGVAIERARHAPRRPCSPAAPLKRRQGHLRTFQHNARPTAETGSGQPQRSQS